MRIFLKLLGLAPSQRDIELRKLIENSYSSIRVVGRGTIVMDPREVYESPEFKQALNQTRNFVR